MIPKSLRVCVRNVVCACMHACMLAYRRSWVGAALHSFTVARTPHCGLRPLRHPLGGITACFRQCSIGLAPLRPETAWLSPPVALSAYFLKGVVPEWDLKYIYYGMMQFMVLQVIGLVLLIVFPQIALWLPTLLYGQ